MTKNQFAPHVFPSYRLDRFCINQGKIGKIEAKSAELFGVEPIEEGLYISDHFGILVKF